MRCKRLSSSSSSRLVSPPPSPSVSAARISFQKLLWQVERARRKEHGGSDDGSFTNYCYFFFEGEGEKLSCCFLSPPFLRFLPSALLDMMLVHPLLPFIPTTSHNLSFFSSITSAQLSSIHSTELNSLSSTHTRRSRRTQPARPDSPCFCPPGKLV